MDMNKRPETMERITTPELAEAFIAEQVEAIQKQVLTSLKSVSAAVPSVSLVNRRVSVVDRLLQQSKLQRQEMNTSKKQVFIFQSAPTAVSYMTTT